MKKEHRKELREMEPEELKRFWEKYHKLERLYPPQAGYEIKFEDVADLAEAFWARVDKSGECWHLTGVRLGYYTQFSANKRSYGAHRLAYALSNNGCPALLVCHTCDNPSCVRPDHLFTGTQQDNVDDMMRKGRHGCHKPGYIHWKERRRLGLPHRECFETTTV